MEQNLHGMSRTAGKKNQLESDVIRADMDHIMIS